MTGQKKKLLPSATKPAQSVEEALRELKKANQAANEGYRMRSLKVHGNICARCGREFAPTQLHLLTVHHKDSDAANNPPDGSNWENLCVYCHDAEHSRELLGDFVDGSSAGSSSQPQKSPGGLGTLGDLLAKARRK